MECTTLVFDTNIEWIVEKCYSQEKLFLRQRGMVAIGSNVTAAAETCRQNGLHPLVRRVSTKNGELCLECSRKAPFLRSSL
jgi:hypothetical protein